MLDKILIANRGEIACRIIKTAKKLGVATVAIYSSADENSLHVQAADEAYWVGEAPALESYLNINAIIKAAVQSKAKAIHPGYGFLSESTELAKACEAHNLVFIGPSISALNIMGSKQLAKQTLEKTDVPLVPGYHDDKQTDEHLLKAAKSIGFPVLLKPANGGGGKGMHAVFKESDFLTSLHRARREAKASFADDTMILEKLLSEPRHIEIQIMADNFGNIVHLYERDCSIQRRHQKMIEEAPAPSLDPTLREQLASAACTVARTIDYRGAGTVEFLVSKDKHFYFMEMNTRLQVEHPVTEMITGLDLVALQIRIAEGHALPFKQKDIQTKGHAIECRIYAEDASQDFMPSIGQIHFLKEPEGQGIRIDSGVVQDSWISQYYDPMIAKLIAYGETREEALQRLKEALKHYAIGGVKSNILFLQGICEDENFAKGKYHIDFLTRSLRAERSNPVTCKISKSVDCFAGARKDVSMLAAAHHYLSCYAKAKDPLQQASFGWQMHLKSYWYYRCLIENEKNECIIYPIDAHTFRLSDRILHAEHKNDQLIVTDSSQRYAVYFNTHAGATYFYTPYGNFCVKELSESDDNHEHQKHADKASLKAPMPATIVALLKKQGDKIQKNEPLMILEAMKMEHTIHAPEDGVLAEYFYKIGEQVHEGAELLRLNGG